jgi:hypothetical protein
MTHLLRVFSKLLIYFKHSKNIGSLSVCVSNDTNSLHSIKEWVKY